MSQSADTLDSFIMQLRQAVGEAEDEAGVLARVEPLVKCFALAPGWRSEAMYHADPQLGFATTLLHVEPDQSLFVVVDSWLPGRGVQPHDHDTWAVVAGVEGVERNQFWRRVDDGSRAGHAQLVALGEQSLGAGETLVMPRGSIHSVRNHTPHISLSLHVYGRHLNHTQRRRFDVARNLELPFIIEAR